jgi:hypothetical protein
MNNLDLNIVILACVGLKITLCSVSQSMADEIVTTNPLAGNAGAPAVKFFDARTLEIEGQAWADVESPFDRWPARAQHMLRQRVWELGHHSTGLCVRFVTNATEIHARWSLTSGDLGMNHMPATGVSGLDLYVRGEKEKWRWLAIGVPEGRSNSSRLVAELSPQTREYLLYLPLYNGVTSLEIGIPADAEVQKAAPRPSDKVKPVVFYGTSITQGGCASRPGMCYSAILGRRLDRPVINLGFTSNGTMDHEVAVLLSEIDAATYVIDCLPNMTDAMVTDRCESFVKTIRSMRPSTPILLVEDRPLADAFLVAPNRVRQAAIRAALRKSYDTLTAAGDDNIAYIAGDTLLAADGEDTVDGSHLTDLGFVHLSNALEPSLRKLLNGN